MIYCPYQDSTSNIRSDIALRLRELFWASILGTPSGRGLYLTVYPLSRPNTDTRQLVLGISQIHIIFHLQFSYVQDLQRPRMVPVDQLILLFKLKKTSYFFYILYIFFSFSPVPPQIWSKVFRDTSEHKKYLKNPKSEYRGPFVALG